MYLHNHFKEIRTSSRQILWGGGNLTPLPDMQSVYSNSRRQREGKKIEKNEKERKYDKEKERKYEKKGKKI